MTGARPSPPAPERYDEVAYRDALRSLGLVPPVGRAEIQLAYRRAARRSHPDLVPEGEERDEATKRIQRINAAREYVLRHHRGHEARARSRDVAADRLSWWLLPIVAVHALASVLALGPFLLLSRMVGSRGRALWKRWRRPSEAGARVWRLWRAVGPHLMALGLFLVAEGLIVKAWFGISFLVLAAADVVSLATGAQNELRDHAVVTRVHGLLREAERSL